jgi:virginiamycin A acetyltransferase
MTEVWLDPALRRSWLAPILTTAYRALGCQRRWRIGAQLMDVLFRLEGGHWYSATARMLLAKYHQVEIGAFSYGPIFRPGYVPPGIVFGRYCSVAAGVRFVNQNHPTAHFSTHPLFYPPDATRTALTIGHDVWIGFDAVILPGCAKIGNGAMIGAGAIVTHDVPDFAIVAGNPARILRYRFDEAARERVTQSQWWLLAPEEARKIADRDLSHTANAGSA